MAVQPLGCLGSRDGNNNGGSRGEGASPRRSSTFCCCPPLLFGKRKQAASPPAPPPPPDPPPREPTPILQLDSDTPHHEINKIEENGDIPSHKSDFDSVRDVAKSPTGSTASLAAPPSPRRPSPAASPAHRQPSPAQPTIEDDEEEDEAVSLHTSEPRRSKPSSINEERFINNSQELQTVDMEDEDGTYDNEERFINLKQDSPSKDVVDRVSVTSKTLSNKEKLSKSSPHSVKSHGVLLYGQGPKDTPVRTNLASAPAISFLGSSVSLEDEAKSVESAMSELSIRDSIKSLSSEDNEKPNGVMNGHTLAGNKISPTRKTPKKIPKVMPKALSSKFTKNKVQPIQQSATLQPFDKPKDALARSLMQIEHPDWETVMLGIQSMESLVKYHSIYLESHLTPVTRAIATQIKNLRSQVARAACRLAGNLFLAQRKALEPEAEELAVPLLHRTADTNKFIRSDANEALDKMCDSIATQKAICIIMTRGAVHQNGVVRCTSARLLSTIAKTSGPDKIFSLPKDIRDKLLQTGADLLAEGSLDTRGHAKHLFKTLSQNGLFFRILRDVIPLSKYRNIEKSLNNIRSQ